MEVEMPILITLILTILYLFISRQKSNFKISYYETKLENRDIDIEHVKNISLIGIFRLK